MTRSRSSIQEHLESNDPSLQALGFEHLIEGLNAGRIRAASRDTDGNWVAHAWVKRGLLYGFRTGKLEELTAAPAPFFDKHTFPLKPLGVNDQVRRTAAKECEKCAWKARSL